MCGVPDAAELGARARDLGRRLLEKGPDFVMGDLWPASVLVSRDGVLHVIDWELSTRGRPCQDLGHLVAHLWMGAGRCMGRIWRDVSHGGAPGGHSDIHRCGHPLCMRGPDPYRGSVYAGGPLGHLGKREPGFRRAVDIAVETLRTGRLPEAARVSRG